MITLTDVVSQLEQLITEYKTHSRYPATYACDLIRMRNDIPSRSEASEFIQKNNLNMKELADQYVLSVSLRTLSGVVEDGR
jgi:hypothetical protein